MVEHGGVSKAKIPHLLGIMEGDRGYWTVRRPTSKPMWWQTFACPGGSSSAGSGGLPSRLRLVLLGERGMTCTPTRSRALARSGARQGEAILPGLRSASVAAARQPVRLSLCVSPSVSDHHPWDRGSAYARHSVLGRARITLHRGGQPAIHVVTTLRCSQRSRVRQRLGQASRP